MLNNQENIRQNLFGTIKLGNFNQTEVDLTFINGQLNDARIRNQLEPY